MEIDKSFQIAGFTRHDKGTAGAVFIRYKYEAAEMPPTISRYTSPYERNGGNIEFKITIPRQKSAQVAAGVIVTRSSKNCYTATIFDLKRIETIRAAALSELGRKIKDFINGNLCGAEK